MLNEAGGPIKDLLGPSAVAIPRHHRRLRGLDDQGGARGENGVLVGTTPQQGEIAAGRSSEEAPIFAAELGRAFVADLMAGGRRGDRLREHEPPVTALK